MMLVAQHKCAADVLNHVVLEQCSIVLKMNAISLRFFAARTEIWLPFFGVFPCTNPPGLWITSQIVVMSLKGLGKGLWGIFPLVIH